MSCPVWNLEAGGMCQELRSAAQVSPFKCSGLSRREWPCKKEEGRKLVRRSSRSMYGGEYT